MVTTFYHSVEKFSSFYTGAIAYMFAIYSSPLQIVPRFVNLLTIFPYHPWLLGWIINLVRIWAYHWTCTFIIGPILFFILVCYFLSRCISRFLIQFSSGTPGNRMKAIFSRTPSFTNNKADAINFFFSVLKTIWA